MSERRGRGGQQLGNAGGPGARRSRFVSLRLKMMVWFTLIFTLFTVGVFGWFYAFTEARLLQRIHDDLVRTVAGAVQGVDVEQLLALADEGEANAAGFSDDPRYAAQLDWLDHVHAVESQAWPYLYRPGPRPGEIEFIVDLYARYDPAKAAAFGEAYSPVTPFPLLGLRERVVNTEPYSDPWGTWISAYAPLTDASGAVVAALGVDFDARHVVETQRLLRGRIYLAFSVSYLLLMMLLYLLSGSLARPIARLTREAERLGEGGAEREAPTLPRQRFQDEIGVLASVFETMAAKIIGRERSLLQQVRQLRIEVDEAKRQQAVSEIVETDFFRDLRSKAAQLRRRGAAGTADDEDR